MKHAAPTSRTLATVAAAVVLVACASQDPSVSRSGFFSADYWEGVIEVEHLSWRIGLEPRSETEILVDAISLWRARQSARSVRVADDGRVELVLPENLGTVRAGVTADGSLKGEVQRADGATGRLRAVRGRRIPASGEDFVVERPDATLAATLLKPEDRTSFPAIVVIHGSGDSDRTTVPYRFWGDYLVQLGFAVVLYDKRGNGASTGDWRSVGFLERAGDVSALVESLADHPEIEGQAIGLLGVSQGVWVAGLAARDNPDIAFVVSISGPAVPPAESDAYAGWVSSRRAGLTEAEVDGRRRLFLLYLETMRNPKSDAVWGDLTTAVEEAKQRPWFAVRPFDRGPREQIREGWYPLVFDYDPLPTLEAVQVPMLWLYGAHDTQLDPQQSVQVLERLKSAGKDYEILVFPDADHGIATPMSAQWKGGEYMTAAPGFFEAIESFLSRFQI